MRRTGIPDRIKHHHCVYLSSFFLAPGLCQSHYYHGTYIIDGNAELAAQVWSLIGNPDLLKAFDKINSGR